MRRNVPRRSVSRQRHAAGGGRAVRVAPAARPGDWPLSHLQAPPGEVPVWSNAGDRSTSCQMLIGVKPEHSAHQANGQRGRGACKRALTGTINGRDAVSRLARAATLVRRGTNPTPVGVARYARVVLPVRVRIARWKRSERAM